MTTAHQADQDGIHSRPPRSAWETACRLHNFYAMLPRTPLHHRDIDPWICLDQWKKDGLPAEDSMDKHVLCQVPKAIDTMVERIIPVMRARGGYIPTIDHGVQPETPWRNDLHYRKRFVELGG